jgi:hypothetical protein
MLSAHNIATLKSPSTLFLVPFCDQTQWVHILKSAKPTQEWPQKKKKKRVEKILLPKTDESMEIISKAKSSSI